MEINDIVKKQRRYFYSGATRSYEARLSALKRLKTAVLENESAVTEALYADFRKPAYETYMCEIALVIEEIDYQIKHLRSFMRTRSARMSLAQFPARSFVSGEPYGVVLIMAPWNYPFLLCMQPLIGALAAGNCAVVKPSAYAPHASAAVRKIIESAFAPEHIAVIEGGREENRALLSEKFDYIFFTGSPAVGKTVMHAAADTLTPVTLELGGKSPVIIDKSANIRIAARRTAFGKVLNAGQTCIAPDYALIHESVKDKFVHEYENALESFFPNGDMSSMPVIVNSKHFDRLSALIDGSIATGICDAHAMQDLPHIVIGGSRDPETRFIEPTVIENAAPDSPIMREEIFGPILPVITYSDIGETIEFVRRRPRPLALYLFTKSRSSEKHILESLSFGGGCINDTILHIASPHLGFGGVGASGMGQYHGRKSYETFTHYRSIMRGSAKFEIPLRCRPYTERKEKIVRRLFR